MTPEPVTRDDQVVRQTAADAAVLLKNDGNALPLPPSGSVALIGPGAGQTMATGLASRWVGTAQTLKLPKTTYAVADDMTGTLLPGSTPIDFTLPAGSNHTWSGPFTATESGTRAARSSAPPSVSAEPVLT